MYKIDREMENTLELDFDPNLVCHGMIEFTSEEIRRTWKPNPLPPMPVSFSKDEFILPGHCNRLLAQMNPHPRDARIWFDEKPHKYYVDRIETSGSVTGLVHAFSDDFDHETTLIRMRRGKNWPRSEYLAINISKFHEANAYSVYTCWNIAQEQQGRLLERHFGKLTIMIKLLEEISNGGRNEILDKKIVDIVQELRRDCKGSIIQKDIEHVVSVISLTNEEICTKWELNGTMAANLGTWMHLQVEMFINMDPCYCNNLEMKTFFVYMRDILLPMNVKSFRTEWEIFSEEENIAGSIDFIGIKPNGHLVLVDWKRTKELENSSTSKFGTKMNEPLQYLDDCKGNHYKLQLNLYKYIIEKNYGYLVDEMQVACFHPDCKGVPFVIDVPLMPNETAYIMAFQREKHASLILSRFQSKLGLG